MAVPITSSPTAATDMDNAFKFRVLEQNDSGLDSLSECLSITCSVDLGGQDLDPIDEISSDSPLRTSSSSSPHSKQSTQSSVTQTCHSSQLKTLTNGLLNLNIEPLSMAASESDCRSDQLSCEERARLEMLERQEEAKENDCLRSFLCDNDSGHFSITTMATDVCDEEISRNMSENEAVHRETENIELERDIETRESAHRLSRSIMRSDQEDFDREETNNLYVSAEQRIALYQGDADGDNWLHLSIINGRQDLALALISLAPDYIWLSYSNLLRQTPLHLAVLTGQHRLARRLLCGGAIVDAQDLRGDTALHIACRLGHDVMVKTLLAPVRFEETQKNLWEIPYQRLPQDLSVQNFEGQTPLHVAVISGYQRVVHLLLEAGADPNSGDAKSGRTALHLAAERGRIGLVELLACRPDVDLLKRNYAGLTAAQLALGRNLDRIAHFLQADCDDISDAESERTIVASDSEDAWSDDGME